MQEEPVLDWLADIALTAIEHKSTTAMSWIKDKRHSLAGLSRLGVLHWIVADLDQQNLCIVAESLGVSVQDLKAVRRVLSKI